MAQRREEHWSLLIVGNGTNLLYADAGVHGIVARVALNEYQIENRGEGTALLKAEAGVSWPLFLHIPQRLSRLHTADLCERTGALKWFSLARSVRIAEPHKKG